MENFTILIVDDQEGPREALRATLCPPYRVYAAGSCSDALSIFRTTVIDLVIQDVHLPDGNGIDLLLPFKRINPAVALILISGDGTLECATEAVQFGALAFLAKPFHIQEVRALVRDALYQKVVAGGQVTV